MGVLTVLSLCSDPYVQISNLLLNSAELKSPSSLTPDRLAELAHLLPLLGVNFLRDLSQAQLLPALPALANVSFSPAQVEKHAQRRATLIKAHTSTKAESVSVTINDVSKPFESASSACVTLIVVACFCSFCRCTPLMCHLSKQITIWMWTKFAKFVSFRLVHYFERNSYRLQRYW